VMGLPTVVSGSGQPSRAGQPHSRTEAFERRSFELCASTARGRHEQAAALISARQRRLLVSLQAASTARIPGMASKHASVATISDNDKEGLNSN